MTDLPDLTILLGPQTDLSRALNALIRENRQFLHGRGMSAHPSRTASPMLRKAVSDRPEAERLAEFEANTKPRPALLSAINFFGPPQAGLMKGELFPEAELKLAELSAVASKARIVVAIDPLPRFFLASVSDVLEERVRKTPWEVLYELSWFELLREVVESLPEADVLVLRSDGMGENLMKLNQRLFGGFVEGLPKPYVLLHQLLTETGHAVMERMLKRGPLDAATVAELYESFSKQRSLDEYSERMGIDKVTAALLDQRFQEDLDLIATLDRVEVI